MAFPIVAIVGRPNVGKSSLLNAIAGRLISIVDATPGVTRDRVAIRVEHRGRLFELIDTGGIGLVDQGELELDIMRQIDFALAEADVLIFVTDVREGVTPLDLEVAAKLRRLSKPTLLVANKVDGHKQEMMLGELYRLGFGDPVPISAKERHGTSFLLDEILTQLPPASSQEDAPPQEVLKLAIVGKPNAGKSTLLNALVGYERVIVSEIPGTTRDAIDTHLQWQGRSLTLIDTAGIKKRRQVDGSLAFYGQDRAERAIRRADVVLLLLDASQEVSTTDRVIAGLVREAAKPCLLVLNKWDLAQEQGIVSEAYLPYLEEQMPGLDFAPLAFISAVQGLNVANVLVVAWSLYEQAGTRVGTGELNRVLHLAWQERKPKVKRGRLPRIYYGTQVATNPPTITLFVNEPSLFNAGYLRYLGNRLRQELPFPEVPILIQLRKSGERRRDDRHAERLSHEHDQDPDERTAATEAVDGA